MKMYQMFTRRTSQMTGYGYHLINSFDGHSRKCTRHLPEVCVKCLVSNMDIRPCIPVTFEDFTYNSHISFWLPDIAFLKHHISFQISDTIHISLLTPVIYLFSDTCHILLLTFKFHISLLIPISSHSYCIYRISSNWKYLHCIKVCVLVCWNIVHWHTHIHSHNYIK